MARNHGSRSATAIRYIPCQVDPGMFRDEWLLFVDTLDSQYPEKTREEKWLGSRTLIASGTPIAVRPRITSDY
jgi:hypothetical protein